MKKIILMLLISVLSLNVFAQFSIEEARENMEKVMDSNGRIKITHPNKESVYLSASDILTYHAYIDKNLNWVRLDIKIKNGEKVTVYGKEGLYEMKYDEESKLLKIYPDGK